jgi:hypothetical protein
MYCSKKCCSAYQKRKHCIMPVVIKNCLRCNKTFNSHSVVHKFCSAYCRDLYNHKYIPVRERDGNLLTKTCNFCKKTFETTNNKKKYCSKECCYEFSKKHKSPTTFQRKYCLKCNSPFKTFNAGRMYCNDCQTLNNYQRKLHSTD